MTTLTLTHADIAILCHSLHMACTDTVHYARATRAAGPEYEDDARGLDARAARFRALHDAIANATILACANED